MLIGIYASDPFKTLTHAGLFDRSSMFVSALITYGTNPYSGQRIVYLLCSKQRVDAKTGSRYLPGSELATYMKKRTGLRAEEDTTLSRCPRYNTVFCTLTNKSAHKSVNCRRRVLFT